MVYAKNTKINRDYEILEKFEAGIVLLGFEAKAVRESKMSLDGSYISLLGGEVFLRNAHISPYQPANTPKNYDPDAPRKLLLNKKEVRELQNVEKEAGLTIVPISVYNKGRKIKVEIAVVRGKKKFDKREDIKKRTSDRESQRTLKYE